MKNLDAAFINELRCLLASEAVSLKNQGRTELARGVAYARRLLDTKLEHARTEADTDHLETNRPLDSWPPAQALCSLCHEPQYRTPSGDCCVNGHGGQVPLAGQTLTDVLRAKPYLRKHVRSLGFPPPRPVIENRMRPVYITEGATNPPKPPDRPIGWNRPSPYQ